MITIGVVVGSTRPGRRGGLVGQWVVATARSHPRVVAGEIELRVLDVADHALPVLDEPLPAVVGAYAHDHTRTWSDAVVACDGFVFVTPEYNHSAPASLKNAIDYLFVEWNHKAAGFVGYGGQGGVRAVEHLRAVLAEVRVADVRTQVALGLFTDFTVTDPAEPGELTPAAHQLGSLHEMLDEIADWSSALARLRTVRSPV